MRLHFHRKMNPSDKIKEATLNLIATSGYDSITMRSIAKEADVALGQLTYYYATKEKLILTVVKEASDLFLEDFEERINKSSNKVKSIEDYFSNLAKNDTRSITVIANLLSESMWNMKLRKIISDVAKELSKYILNIYEKEENITKEDAMNKTRRLYADTFEKAMERILKLDVEE